MKKLFIPIISFLFVLLSLQLVSAAGTLNWNSTFGGSEDDEGYAVLQTDDGGYLVLGLTESFGERNGDIYLVKTNSGGKLVWNKTFGTRGGLEVGRSIKQTSDGGYVIAGSSNPTGGDIEMYLVKIDEDGTEEWSKFYDASGSDEAQEVIQTNDGGYLLVGSSTTGSGYWPHDIFVVKTFANGTEEWRRTIGGDKNDFGFSARENISKDSSYLILGRTQSFGAGSHDIYLVSINQEGKIEWNNTYGGTGRDGGYSIVSVSGGDYVISGWTESYGSGGRDAYILKINPSGAEEWNKTFGGGGYDETLSVKETNDGGLILAGITDSYGAGEEDAYILRTDGSGAEKWNKTYGGSGYDGARDIIQNTLGDYIVAGYTAASPADMLLFSITEEVVEEDNALDNKLEALEVLESLESRRYKKAVRKLKKSLGNKVEKGGDKSITWIDSNHIECKGGRKVFEYEREAVEHLNEKHKKKDKEDVEEAISLMVEADRILAKTAIDEAEDGDDKERAIKDYEKAASKKKDKGKIRYYRRAWKHLCKK